MKRILYLQGTSDLTNFSETCLKLTPKIFLPSPQDLYLEIGSSQKCLGGEAKVLFLLEELLTTFDLKLNWVLTENEAWAKALAVGEKALLPPGKSRAALLALPIERLVYCGNPGDFKAEQQEREKLTSFMRRVGLKTIGEFVNLSELSLIRRFGKAGLFLKDWVQGKRECCLKPFVPQEVISEIIETDSEIALEGLIFYIKGALSRAEARLYGRGLAARQLKLGFHLEGGEFKVRSLDLCEPTRDPKVLLRLLREVLDGMQWEAPLEKLEIAFSQTVPYVCGQLSLFDKTENISSDLAQYVSRLKTRYGGTVVGFPEIRESHLPERAMALAFPPQAAPPALPHLPKRPLFVYSPPKPYLPPRGVKLTPSENLSTQWWETGGGQRHYFIADTAAGEKLWVFFEKRNWFLHGTFD